MLLVFPFVAGAVAPGLGVERVRVEVIVAPGVAEVILGPGAERAGEALAVDVDLLVPLAPPGGRGVVDVQEQADEPARRPETRRAGQSSVPSAFFVWRSSWYRQRAWK